MSESCSKKASKTLARMVVCLLLLMAIPSYGLDLGCALSLEPCVSIDCCSDCGISAPPADRVEQSAPEFEPLVMAARFTLLKEAEPKLFDYPFWETELPIRPPCLTEPNRGPPSLSF